MKKRAFRSLLQRAVCHLQEIQDHHESLAEITEEIGQMFVWEVREHLDGRLSLLRPLDESMETLSELSPALAGELRVLLAEATGATDIAVHRRRRD